MGRETRPRPTHSQTALQRVDLRLVQRSNRRGGTLLHLYCYICIEQRCIVPPWWEYEEDWLRPQWLVDEWRRARGSSRRRVGGEWLYDLVDKMADMNVMDPHRDVESYKNYIRVGYGGGQTDRGRQVA